jgi:RNA polymerase sigma-70 factor (ECF subfamily)
MGSTETGLTGRIAAGERDAFAELLDRYGARVHRLVRRYARGEADAEDLTQEIFLDLYRCSGSFRGESALSTWVYRVALNHCLRYREKLERAQPPAETYEDGVHETPDSRRDPAGQVVARELTQQVHAALDDLSRVHRDVVVLHELHGLTYRECAEVLQVPVGTVKSRLSNAFRCLRASLGGYVLGEPAPLRPDAVGEPL